jgi:hypothetical protein
MLEPASAIDLALSRQIPGVLFAQRYQRDQIGRPAHRNVSQGSRSTRFPSIVFSWVDRFDDRGRCEGRIRRNSSRWYL